MNNIQSTKSKIQRKFFSTIFNIVERYCNRIILISSFEDLDETLSLYLIIVKSKHVNSERASQNSSKLYRSYVNDLDKINQNDQISLLFMNNKLLLNATVFLVASDYILFFLVQHLVFYKDYIIFSY